MVTIPVNLSLIETPHKLLSVHGTRTVSAGFAHITTSVSLDNLQDVSNPKG